MSFLLRLAVALCPLCRAFSLSALLIALFALGEATVANAASSSVTSNGRDHSRDGVYAFRHGMFATIRADHPAIVPVAAAIRALTERPLEQLVIVNDVSHLLVDYDDDQRVYGRTEYQATLDEMIERRRAAGWIYLRDDCDGRAVFAAHLLAALEIPWRLEASYWKGHAWVVAHVNGVDYDLLASNGSSAEERRPMYRAVGRHFVRPPVEPPYFKWRQVWKNLTNENLEIGKCLGLIELDSTHGDIRERGATDWTKVHPGGAGSPLDPRTLTASYAAFPLGEALHSLTLVQTTERPVPPSHWVSATSGPTQPHQD